MKIHDTSAIDGVVAAWRAVSANPTSVRYVRHRWPALFHAIEQLVGTESAGKRNSRYARAIGHAAEVLHEQTCKDNQHDDDPVQVWPCFQLATRILKEIQQ